MNEELHRFGAGGRLAGIVALPDERAREATETPAVVLITAGLLHKAGPYRLYTQLARTLAAAGFPCLRFDLSGIGESHHGNSGDVRAEDAETLALQDVRAAMDKLVDDQVASRFVLAGLCSGAEVAHRVALQDARVCGLVALDGFILRNWQYHLRHYLPRVFSLSKWLDFIAQRLPGRRGTEQPADAEQDALAFWRGPPPERDHLEREFRQLVARDVQQLQVFSGGSGNCSYRRQFRDVFRRVRFGDTLTVHFNRDADHMYILDADRRCLVRQVTQWMQSRFARAGRPAPLDARTATAHSHRMHAGRPLGLAGRRLHE